MPSSLIFVALAAAWLVVLVPMVAKRRQEVVRTADSALASRVLQRPAQRYIVDHGEERRIMTERIALEREPEMPDVPEQRARRPYRPGRGGFDPAAAELAANARYALRQRIVIGLAIGAAVTLIGAIFAAGVMWGAHLAMDAGLLGYLGYLRRQVRIEEDIRSRRADRFAKVHGSVQPSIDDELPDNVEDVDELDGFSEYDDYRDFTDYQDDETQEEAVRTRVGVPPHPGAAAVELDDEDPVFDELRPRFEPPYRRAVGE